MDKILQFAKEHGYDKVTPTDMIYNGYKVYFPEYSSEDTAYVGLPLAILVKGDEIRMTTPEEAELIQQEYSEQMGGTAETRKKQKELAEQAQKSIDKEKKSVFKAHNIFSYIILGVVFATMIPFIIGLSISNQILKNVSSIILASCLVVYLIEQAFMLRKEITYYSPAGKTAQIYILVRYILYVIVTIIVIIIGVTLLSDDNFASQYTSTLVIVEMLIILVASTLQIRADKMLRKVQEQKILSDNE